MCVGWGGEGGGGEMNSRLVARQFGIKKKKKARVSLCRQYIRLYFTVHVFDGLKAPDIY